MAIGQIDVVVLGIRPQCARVVAEIGRRRIEVEILLHQAVAIGSRIRYCQHRAVRQLALDVYVPLLDVAQLESGRVCKPVTGVRGQIHRPAIIGEPSGERAHWIQIVGREGIPIGVRRILIGPGGASLRASVVEHSITCSNDRLAVTKRTPGETDARLQARPIGLHADGAARIDTGNQHLSGRKQNVGKTVVSFRNRGGDIVRQAEIDGEILRKPNVVLHEAARFLPAASDHGSRQFVIASTGGGNAQQKTGNGVAGSAVQRAVRINGCRKEIVEREGAGESGVAQGILLHQARHEADVQRVFPVHDIQDFREIVDIGSPLKGRESPVAQRIEAGDGKLSQSGRLRGPDVGAGYSHLVGEVCAISNGLNVVEVAVVSNGELVDHVGREHVGLRQRYVASVRGVVGGTGEISRGAEAGQTGGKELKSIVPAKAPEEAVVVVEVVIQPEIPLHVVQLFDWV